MAVNDYVNDFIKTKDIEIDKVKMALEIAYEAGKWAGQVELEEHYDREQYANSLLEVAYSHKNAMPIKPTSIGREVTIHLRSEEWREGVRKSSRQAIDKALQILINSLARA